MKRILFSIAWLVLLGVSAINAAEVKIFRNHSQEDFLQGTLEGVSLDPLGRIMLADHVEKLAAFEEPFVLAAAVHPDGWVLGTGNSGRVLLVDRQGQVRELFSTVEPQVFAVWVDDDGTVFAGSSPQGKVYRYRKGETEVFFEPEEDYIWQLARSADGSLLAATGTKGRLYGINGRGEGEIRYDADDTHLRSLEALPDGGVLLGTAGQGLVLRLDKDGRARTLYDGERPEVVDFALDPKGGIYVATLASEASLVDLSSQQSKNGEDGEGDGDESGTSTVTVSGDVGLGSRPARFTGARSEIIRIAHSGAIEPVWSFQDETVYSLLWHRGRLWIGTGLEGKLYSRRDGTMVLEEDVDERQIVGVLKADPGPAFMTTNAAAIYLMENRPRKEGTYMSPVLDAEQVARFGSLRWHGEAGANGPPLFSVRSGISSEPDLTWSDWTPSIGGREVDLSGLPRGRYVQWRAELATSEGASPRLDAVHLSYRQDNVAPEVTSLSVLEPGKILVPTSFNPAQQAFEPVSSSREGIFKTLSPSKANDDGRTKSLWKKGYRTLSWEASDDNGDDMGYCLQFRADRESASWLDVVRELDQSWYSFDSMVLPDGLYRFRLVITDQASNLPGEGLTADRITEPVVVDHGAPRIERSDREKGGIRVWVTDDWSPLRDAVFSIDAGEWKPVRVEDELLDEQSEEIFLEIPSGPRLVLLRLTDAAHNVVTQDLSGRMK